MVRNEQKGALGHTDKQKDLWHRTKQIKNLGATMARLSTDEPMTTIDTLWPDEPPTTDRLSTDETDEQTEVMTC